MRRTPTVLIVSALLLLFAVACKEQQPLKTSSCLDRYTDVAPSPLGRDQIKSAIEIANRLLDEDGIYSLTSGWGPVAAGGNEKARKTFPVHVVAVDPGGRYSLAFVPNGNDCILVDTSVALAAVDRLVMANSTVESVFPNELIVAYFLLHELGHIVERPVNGVADELRTKALCRELGLEQFLSATLSPTNDICTTLKALEIAADQFAAEQIKRAWEGRNATRRAEAGILQMALTAMAIEIIGNRVEANKSRNEGPDVYCDAGFSHPNFELRLLFVFGLLSPDSNWTLRRALEKRSIVCRTTTNLSAEQDQLERYMTMPTQELLIILDKATILEKIDLITALSVRKEAAVVEAISKIADLADVSNPEAAADLRVLRSEAIGALGVLSDRSVLPLLIRKLSSPAVTEQMAAAYALGKLRDLSTVSSLIAHADRKNSLFFRTVIEALGDIGGADALKFLEEIKRSDVIHGEAASKSISEISNGVAGKTN